MEKLFKVFNGETERSIVWMSFEDNNINMKTLRGTVLETEEALKLIFAQEEVNKVVIEYLNGDVCGYKRINPFKFVTRVGMSGCRDFKIQFAERDYGYAMYKTKFLFHDSSCGKINEGIYDLFIFDLIDLIRFGRNSENHSLLNFDIYQPIGVIQSSINYQEIKPVTDEELKEKGFILPKDLKSEMDVYRNPSLNYGLNKVINLREPLKPNDENTTDLRIKMINKCCEGNFKNAIIQEIQDNIKKCNVSPEYKIILNDNSIIRVENNEEIYEALKDFNTKGNIKLEKYQSSQYKVTDTIKILDSNNNKIGVLYKGDNQVIEADDIIESELNEEYAIIDCKNDKILVTDEKSEVVDLKIVKENKIEKINDVRYLLTNDDILVGIINLCFVKYFDDKRSLLVDSEEWKMEDKFKIIKENGDEYFIYNRTDIIETLNEIDDESSFSVYHFVNDGTEFRNIIIEEKE